MAPGLASTKAGSHDEEAISCCGCAVAASGLWLVAPGSKKVCGCKPVCMRLLFFLVNLCITPPLLMWHFFRAYILPCCVITIRRIVRLVACQYKLCPCKYHDLRFPANDNSIGEVEFVYERKATCHCGVKLIKKPEWDCGCLFFKCDCLPCRFQFFCLDPRRKTVAWKRTVDFAGDEESGSQKMRLFEGKIEADDVCQGQLGDCWMLAAIATVAEDHSDVIRGLFVTQDYDPCGVYQIRLFDERKKHWRQFTIDDRVPVNEQGQALFTAPNKGEVWVLLLEKAFARMYGSYGALQGGRPAVAMTAFTGNESETLFSCGDGGHEWYLAGDKKNKKHKSDKVFKAVSKALDKGVLMCAGTKGPNGKTDKDTTHGIAHKHAYSLLDTYTTPTGNKLVQLRNPWGAGEWTGGSVVSVVDQVGMTLRGRKLEAGRGTFWMRWDDFAKMFSTIDCCVVSRNVGSFQLEVYEHLGLLGPVVGLLKATLEYWVMCVGFRIMWWPTRKTTLDVMEALL